MTFAILPIPVARMLSSVGYRVYNCYGLSETCAAIAFNKNVLRYPRSVGKINDNVEIRIAKKDKRGVGEIQVRSNQVMQGYYRNSEKTALCMDGDWFRTGDLGYLDHKKYLFVLGRTKEVIITPEGKKIYPADLEEFFMDVPSLEKICAFGLSVKGNEQIAICAQIPASADKNSVMKTLSEKNNELPAYMRAQNIFIEFEPLPMTRSGKVSSLELIKKYGKVRKK